VGWHLDAVQGICKRGPRKVREVGVPEIAESIFGSDKSMPRTSAPSAPDNWRTLRVVVVSLCDCCRTSGYVILAVRGVEEIAKLRRQSRFVHDHWVCRNDAVDT
jgi:hypothetical protein